MGYCPGLGEKLCVHRVSVIIVTYNSAAFIRGCLEALEGQAFHDFEVIVVDNGSTDDTLELVSSYSEVNRIIEERSNLGFAGGNNLGATYARGEYIALLNPDTIAEPHWLSSLVDAMDAHPEVGICASKLLVYGSEVIDSAGDGCLAIGRGFKRGEGKDTGMYSRDEYIFGACGGAMMIRRAVIDEIGFFDLDFFLIYEDTDFCFRAQLAGWKCFYVSDAVVWHKVRSSIGEMSDMAVYYSARNALYVWWKNMPTWLVVK